MGKTEMCFEIIVGTYEEFVIGYQFSGDGYSKKGQLTQVFATHSHRASVRSVACCGKLVVSGGADETINIYDMFTRKECGMLMEHDGTITSLSFTPDCSHVISASEDGSIKIFRQGSWQLEKEWTSAHKGTVVTCVAVHPSGKMALSVGKDHTLRTWNLVKGRPAYTTNLYSRCRQLELVVWAPGGILFAIPMESKIEITSTEKGGVLHNLQLATKVTSCIFLSDKVLCVGEASGEVSGYSTLTAERLWSIPGEERVRGLAHIRTHLVTATSTGVISVYSVTDMTQQPELVTSVSTGCRITCVALYDCKSEVKVKKEPADEIETLSEEKKLSSKKKSQALEVVHDQEESSTIPSKKQKVSNGKSKETTPVEENQVPSKKKKKAHQVVTGQKDAREVPTKKHKIAHSSSKKTKTNKIVHLPSGQKWVVEDSIR